MFTYEEVRRMWLRKLGKELFSDLTILEKALFTDIWLDVERGRYSKLLQMSNEDREEFLKFVNKDGRSYSELDDAERWAYEDIFCMEV